MSFLAQVHIYCFLMSYLVVLACEFTRAFGRPSGTIRVVLFAFAFAGFVAHTAYLITRSQQAGLPPLLASQKDWLLVLAWLGSLLYLILLLSHGKLTHGLFMLPAILLLIVVAIFVSDQSSGNMKEIAQRRWGMFHATSLVLGIGAVVAAAISGLMYLLHHQRLRSRSSWMHRLSLPNLENLTAFNRWMVVFSVPCLTIGLLTGFLLIAISPNRNAQDAIAWTDPTIVTTVLVWFGMVIVLLRLLSSSQQTGKAVAQLSLLSGGFLLVSILGPMILAGAGSLTTFHGRSSTAVEENNSAQNAGAATNPSEVSR